MRSENDLQGTARIGIGLFKKNKKSPGKAREAGGGRKRFEAIKKDINEIFLHVLRDHTAGDPMKKEIIWTNLTKSDIQEKLLKKEVRMSRTVIKRFLRNNGFKRRKLHKTRTMKETQDRNEQFENIAAVKAEFMASENPVVSMDTKKKELLGTFYREGMLYTKEGLRVYDHDFPSFADGVVIPHGIYDLKRNTGYVNIGTSKDTSEFACASLLNWWLSEGKALYPNATSILVLCDGGGSNSSCHHIFKEDLLKLADVMGIAIRIAHYPPYTSKYNPIEHRLFPHVTRACQGVVFENIDIVKELIGNTSTKTGLSVKVNVIDKEYALGRKVSDDFKNSISSNPRIRFHQTLPKLNYSVLPTNRTFI